MPGSLATSGCGRRGPVHRLERGMSFHRANRKGGFLSRGRRTIDSRKNIIRKPAGAFGAVTADSGSSTYMNGEPQRRTWMVGMCIYVGNRGLGACAGRVSKVMVASKRTAAWKGLMDLTERLKETGEVPGVCEAHEKRAGENGYILASDATPQKGTRRKG